MAVRIVAEPLLLSPDGTILPKGQISLALYFLDPLKYSERGLQEAIQAVNPAKMAPYITQHVAAHLDAYAQQALPRSQKQFQDCVAGEGDSLENKIAGFLNKKQGDLLADIPAAFAELSRERNQARLTDAALGNSLSYCAPEFRGRYLQSMRDTAYAEDENFSQSASEARRKLSAALDYIPQYKNYAEAHNCTIISVKDLLPVIHARACACPGGNLVAMDADFLATEKPERVATLLKEEILHLADEDVGFSQSAAFRKAAEVLFQDDKKVQEISNYVRPVHASQKISLRQMLDNHTDPAHIQRELLTEYFHIRDHWLAVSREESADSDVSVAELRSGVDQIMQKMFGQELHQLCQAFEKAFEAGIEKVPARCSKR